MYACNNSSHFKGEKNNNIKLSFLRFDQDFNKLSDFDNFDKTSQELDSKYGLFYDIYNQGIIRLGSHNSPEYSRNASFFLNDEIYKMTYDSVQLNYPNLAQEEKKITKAFINYNRIFPKRQIPAIYTHLSGFNEPIVVADSILSVSLDNYLGENHSFYKNLGVYTYLLPRKNRDYIVIDAMRGWLMSEFDNDDVQKTLLDNMIYEGKILFTLSVILSDMPEYKLLGLSEKQYTWLMKNELNLWQFAIEKQHMFTTHQLTISKYINDGPFFNFFGSGSSPLVGKYLGWQVVNAYMQNNKEVDIEKLFSLKNGQEILELSGYRP